MAFIRSAGRARCALAAGTIAVAVVGGTVFAAGAANALPAPSLGSTIGGAVGTAPTVGAGLGSTVTGVGGTVTGITGTDTGVGGTVTGVTGTGAVVPGGVLTGTDVLNGTPITAVAPVVATVPVTVSTGNVLGTSSNGSRNSSTSSSTNSSNTSSTTSTGGATTSNSSTTSTSGGSSTAANSSNSSNSGSSSNSTNSSNSSTTTGTNLSQVQLSRSASTVYPAKDGYGDTITFDVRPLDKDGNPVPVVGKAYVVLNGKIVKTFVIDGSTATVSWDGLVDGQVVPGAYSFVLDVQSAAGTSARTSSAFSVSGKKLSTRTVIVRHAFRSAKRSVALPKIVKRNLAYGAITVRATTKHAQKKTVRLTVVRSGKDLGLTIRKGKHASNRVTVPAASKSVRIKPAKRTRTSTARLVTLTYHYSKLG